VQTLEEMNKESQAYFDFINTLDSDYTKEMYQHCVSKFLKYCKLDLASFLKLPPQDISILVTKYLVVISPKYSRKYKNMILSAIKHACDMNDIALNWKKIKKFIKSEKTENSTNGKDRGYTHQEIQTILDFSDQRIKTVFLVLASTGVRAGALNSLRVGDLKRIDSHNLYKITVYSGDKESYQTFCTPETAKEIDIYLDFRKRHGEKITADSFLIVKKFNTDLDFKMRIKGKQFSKESLQAILGDYIKNSGLREIDHVNQFKRKEVPRLHGFRKFFTTQLINSKVNPEIREMLLGHKIGLASCYYRPTEEEMLAEYMKAVNLLTINEENRLKMKVEKLEVEKNQFDSLAAEIAIIKKRFKMK
jgi:integrase